MARYGLKLKPDVIEYLKKHYATETPEKIAKRFHVKYQTILGWVYRLRKNGVEIPQKTVKSVLEYQQKQKENPAYMQTPEIEEKENPWD